MGDQLTLISSAESGGSPSPQNQSGGEQSPSAKRRHTAKGYSGGIGQKSQLLRMSGSSTEEGTRELPFSAEDSRASASAVAGSRGARRMTVTSGQKCCGLLQKQDPVSCWQRMLLESSIWHSTRCFLTWKAKGTPQGRLYFQLAVSMPSTRGQGSGFLPTPTANEDAAGTCQGSMQLMLANHPEVRSAGSGTLSVLFVEWLMGYPTRHTESLHLATPSSLKSLRKS